MLFRMLKESFLLKNKWQKEMPTPKHIVELCICKCKTGCESLGCSCKKNILVCIEMCMCNDCKSCSNEELIINNESWVK